MVFRQESITHEITLSRRERHPAVAEIYDNVSPVHGRTSQDLIRLFRPTSEAMLTDVIPFSALELDLYKNELLLEGGPAWDVTRCMGSGFGALTL